MGDHRDGGCICGDVRFRAPEPLRTVNLCHCTECRRMAGGASGFTACDADGFELVSEGDLRWFAGPTSATGGERGFCGRCGAYLLFRIPGDPLLYLSASALDDESGLVTEAHIFWDSRGPWEPQDDSLPKIDGYGEAGLDALYGGDQPA